MATGRMARPWQAGLAALLAATLALAGCAPLSDDELRRQAGAVEATAAEGAVLARQVALDRSTENFVRIHGDELAAQMDHTVAKLREAIDEDEVPDELLEPANRTIGLAQDAADALQGLTRVPGAPEAGSAIEQRLEQTADAAARLAEEL